jgi:hypothetical protein
MDAGDIVATNGAESRKKAKKEKRKQRDVDGTAGPHRRLLSVHPI